ncbi:hypothetical protein [Mucilaginibacter sp. 44-25]|uniref:hypothetical protein n=1 Tax=Mucilaginibacter sp. 44-25 TaxID=1895794 RepID=UPI0009595096|nr:hypothetical protein [Mucilaginibacter sp. 44-25]OJW17281.1 MAG: hypothetical protein BGO48_06915 [Mucilaginibacter sp. 44-25]
MNWIEHRALYELYATGSVKINKTIEKSAEIIFLNRSLGLLQQKGNNLIAADGFLRVYETKFKDRYLTYRHFLQTQELLKLQTRFEENDIQILMNINDRMLSGELSELRQQIIDYDESLRGVSLMFFKNEKYLLDKPSLIDALKKMLNVEAFSNEKDQQYMYRLECDEPQRIVLCENLDFLTKPNKPRKHHIELWYAGGKNVAKLHYAKDRDLPIYYSCDWDYDGLFIIYPLVKQKIPNITLLLPNGMPKSISETEHRSLWQNKTKRDELADTGTFNTEELSLIDTLISQDQWIIEESNDLVTMLNLS